MFTVSFDQFNASSFQILDIMLANNMGDLLCDQFCADSHTVGKRAIQALIVGYALGLFSQTCSSNKFQSFSVRMTCCMPVYFEHFSTNFGKVKFGEFHVPTHTDTCTHPRLLSVSIRVGHYHSNTHLPGWICMGHAVWAGEACQR